MAEKAKPEEKSEAKREERKGGKKKRLHLHQIITTRAQDGTFGHEHVYKEKPEDMHSRPPVFAGTSQDMDDLHQHMDDHFGGGAEQEEPEEQGGEQPAAGAEPAAGAQPQG
jgi:hypothetical protein